MVFLSAFTGLSCSVTGPRADLVLRGGAVVTLDPDQPRAEALAIGGDALLAVGSATEMDRFIGHQTAVVELGGRMVLPGFIDSHIHFQDGSLGLEQIRLHDARSLQEIQEIVRVYAEAHTELDWLVGMGWKYSHVREGQLPTRYDLDEVVSDRPLFLEAYDGHTGWVNSMALELAGIDQDSRPDGYGEIVFDPVTGEPTGILKEEGAMSRVSRLIPSPSRQERLDALRRGFAYAHRFGVTSIHTAGGSLDSRSQELTEGDHLDLYEELERKGELALRVSFSMLVDGETPEEELDGYRQMTERFQGPWIRAGAAKLFMDGVIESHTAALLAPYADNPSSAGSTEHGQEEIETLIARIDRAGLQILTHAIGDRAVRMVLDAYEKAAQENRGRERRHRIEHIEIVSIGDRPRFASLGVIASMQPYHASPDFGAVWVRAVGPQRAPRGFAWKSLCRSGARLALGSDWPVVDIDPLLGIYTAVTRQDLDGEPEGGWIPDERLSLKEAIEGYTLGGAYASFEEDIKGSIERGKLADLVVLTEDIFKIPQGEILDTEVAMTVLGGKVVYVSPSFLTEEMRESLLENP